MTSVMDELSSAVEPLRGLIEMPGVLVPSTAAPTGPPIKVFSSRQLAEVINSLRILVVSDLSTSFSGGVHCCGLRPAVVQQGAKEGEGFGGCFPQGV